MADIFREVDEELRQEHYKKLWDKYGKAVIAAAVLLVLVVGGYQAWKAWDLNQRQERSNRYAEALTLIQQGETAEAQAILAEMGDAGSGGYGLLSSFQEARLKSEAGDAEGAAAIWERIADSSAPRAFRGAATLLLVLHQLDSGDPAALEARLQPLMEGDSDAYRASARELSALLALRQGDEALARERYAAVADDATAPGTLRTRATQMLEVLGPAAGAEGES